MTQTSRLLIDHVETPIGRFALVADEEGRLRAAGFIDRHVRMARILRGYSNPATPAVVDASNLGSLTSAIEAYFGGDFAAIDRLAVFAEGTDFQRAVWSALREVPCGETWSYGDVARRIGIPSAVRAVGRANGANPVSLVVPCHRVIGSNGTLTGYGGGIDRKRWLLAHERRANGSVQLPLHAVAIA
jgi:methylated-DNA-[protein]-cysteine S-methyltransferase